MRLVLQAAGAKFAKWRSPLQISRFGPTKMAIEANMNDLARYAGGPSCGVEKGRSLQLRRKEGIMESFKLFGEFEGPTP